MCSVIFLFFFFGVANMFSLFYLFERIILDLTFLASTLKLPTRLHACCCSFFDLA